MGNIHGLEQAVEYNRRLAKSLGWQANFDDIVRRLGFTSYTPGEREFADAVARWQRDQGLKSDGTIGPHTWSKMRSAGVTGTITSRPLDLTTIQGGGKCERDTKVLIPETGNLVPMLGHQGRHIQLHSDALRAYSDLVLAARQADFKAPLLEIISGFRTMQKQQELWDAALKRYGTPEVAKQWVARPGHSIHQSGRAIDFWIGIPNDSSNVTKQRELPIYKWLLENAHRFGFAPYSKEPWHWEYTPSCL